MEMKRQLTNRKKIDKKKPSGMKLKRKYRKYKVKRKRPRKYGKRF